MDKLEKFIVDNKDNFDEPRKPEKGWEQLSRKLSRGAIDLTFYWKVAAILFFISTVVLVMLQFRPKQTPKMAVKSQDMFENFYVNQIASKRQEFTKMVGAEMSKELFHDLAAFDSAYVELSASFQKVRNQELAEAMLENLRLRILILNEQIELVKQGGVAETSYHSS